MLDVRRVAVVNAPPFGEATVVNDADTLII